MKTLKSLVNVVSRNKVKKIDVIGNPSDNDTKLNTLYNGLLNGRVNSNEDALALLYSGEEDKNALYKLKHTLKERLANTLFFIDLKEGKYNDSEKTYYICMKDFLGTEILNMRGEMETASVWLTKLFETTKKYEFTELNYFICKRLVVYYGLRAGERKKLEHYTKNLIEYELIMKKETNAFVKCVDLLSYYVKNKSSKDFIALKADNYLNEIEKIQLDNPSSPIVYFSSMIMIAKFMSLNDYVSTVDICKSSLEKLSEYPTIRVNFVLSLNHQLVASCIHLKRYDEAKEAIDKCLSLQEREKLNWFKTKELHLSLCFHTRKYQEAWGIFTEVKVLRGFSALSPTDKEMWNIYGAWMHLLTLIGKIVPSEKQIGQPFRLSRFLNEVSHFSKDKRGMNVPILLLQVLFALQQKKYDLLIDKVEAISKYKSRYLDRENNFRSNCMIRMIMEMEKCGFRKKKAINKTKELLADMLTVPLDISNQSHDIEVLPNEDVWELITGLLPEDGFFT